MNPTLVAIFMLIVPFVPAVVISWHAKRSGRSWVLWFFLGGSWALLSIALSLFYRNPPSNLRGVAVDLFQDPMVLIVPVVIIIIYAITNRTAKKQDREAMKWCLGCQRYIPFDAKICPNCSYDFTGPLFSPSPKPAPRPETISPMNTPLLAPPVAPPVTPTSVATPVPPGIAHDQTFGDLIRTLANLRDEGLLTDEEFQAKKAEVLARI